MRLLRIVVVTVVILIVLVVLWRGRLTLLTPAGANIALPLDLKEIIPASWQVVPGKYQHCDFDGDKELEWLVIYRYDQTSVPPASAQAKSAVARSAIGGVIYDAQPNLTPQQPGSKSLYRPGLLVPYRLLPDLYPGKGQGYLGESDVTLLFSPALTQGAACSASEIAVLGYSDSPFPTRLSVFHWGGTDIGYRSQHFVGNAEITVAPDPALAQVVNEVATYNRFNDRSRLCELRRYRRRGAAELLDFVEDPAAYTIAFCFNAPADPVYPEAAVVAALRGQNPNNQGGNATPTQNSFLTTEAAGNLPAELSRLGDPAREPFRIVALTNPGGLPGFPSPGVAITDTNGVVWLWGEQRVAITTTLALPGGQRDVLWELVSLADTRVGADTHWRIDRLDLR